MAEKIYISDKLEKDFKSFHANLIRILARHGKVVKHIRMTKDIWCRDYMPVQGADGSFIRFKYKPSYLTSYKKYQDKITDVDSILTDKYQIVGAYESPKWEYKKSDIKLDGGAIEIFHDKGIISDRVFRENKRDEVELLSEIKRLLGLTKLTVIPQHPNDFTGHVDGLVRFIDHQTVLINNLSKEGPKQWIYGFKMALFNAGYKMEELPYRAYNNKGDDAKGIYMNFLKLSDLIIMPTFTFKKEDEEAKKKLEEVFPGRKVESIYATDLAKHGGIVNCVTWNR